MAFWQDLVSEYGFTNSYQSVQHFVRKVRGTHTPEARVVIVTAPGQKRKWITARARWCAILIPATIGARGYS